MIFFKKTVPFVLGMILMTGTAFAQGQQMQQMQNNAADSISDAELENFVEVAQQLQVIGQDVQSKAQNLLKDEGMEFQRFQQIMMSKQNPQMAKNVEVTDEEEATINKVQPELQKIQQQAQQRQMSTIQESELSLQRFQQIAQAVQSNPKVMQRFQKMSASSEEDGN